MITLIFDIGQAKECHSHVTFKSPHVKSYLNYCVQSLDADFEGEIDKLSHTHRTMTKIVK